MSEPYETIGTNDNSSFFGVFPPPFVDDRSSKKARWKANGMDANNPLPTSYRDALRDSGLGKNSIHGMTEGEEFHDDDWDFEPGDVMDPTGRNQQLLWDSTKSLLMRILLQRLFFRA
ncbi:hypothetical protein AB3S75_015415 [Citrus x aurantiifolia]